MMKKTTTSKCEIFVFECDGQNSDKRFIEFMGSKMQFAEENHLNINVHQINYTEYMLIRMNKNGKCWEAILVKWGLFQQCATPVVTLGTCDGVYYF